MNKEFSLYLDCCRLFAALTVVLAHLTQFGLASGEWTRFLPSNGQDAVIVFFVLSGLVIYHTVRKKVSSLSEFIAARATRIYSVAIPVVVITVCVDLIEPVKNSV